MAAVVYNLGEGLQRRGHQVSYVFLDDLMEAGTSSKRFAELAFSFRLARYIKENRKNFAIVNLHAPTGLVYGIKRKWGSANGYPPYVMTLHGLEERRVYAMTREQKKGLAWNFSAKNRIWHRLYHQPRFRWCIKTADGAHTHCRDAWTLLQLKYNLDSERVAYIPSGVGERFFVPREYRPGADVKLLYAGTWLDQRAIYYIRAALERLAAKLPGLTLTVAGGGVPAEEILRFFGEGLRSRIAVRPVVPWDKMPELYAEHDVFLFPSLMEGLPTVLLEAMATGMPVITTETCGMTDVVEDEWNGRLIRPADAGAIEKAVLYFANSLEARRKLGSEARETMKRYTWERSARQLEELFQRVIQAENRKQA